MRENNYPIKEIFFSVQGEGLYVGLPVIFIRFSGCNLKCKFCDTQHHLGKLYSRAMIRKELRDIRAKYPVVGTVVLTGGEPTLFIDKSLLSSLKSLGFRVHIETNGTKQLTLDMRQNIDWITVSPKQEARAELTDPNEVKVVVSEKTPMDFIRNMRRKYIYCDLFYLQPESAKSKNITHCVKIIEQNCVSNYRLGYQLHKLYGVQ